MTTEQMIAIGLLLAAFGVFAGVLFWAERRTNSK